MKRHSHAAPAGSHPLDQSLTPAAAAGFEQQMAQCGLSHETRQFVRQLHLAEKHLNDAFEAAHDAAVDPRSCAQISRLYHELFGTTDEPPDA